MARGAGTQYPIGSPTRQCAATGRDLAIGEKYIGALCQQRDGDDFVRLDFSDAAWKAGARPAATLLMLGYWRAVMSEGGPKRNMLIDDDSLLDLFEQSGEGDDAGTPERLAFRFVLALILMRKRLLTQESSKDGGRTMLFRPKGVPKGASPEEFAEVVDPGLTEELVASVTAQLQAVLSDTLAAPAGPGSAAPGGAA